MLSIGCHILKISRWCFDWVVNWTRSDGSCTITRAMGWSGAHTFDFRHRSSASHEPRTSDDVSRAAAQRAPSWRPSGDDATLSGKRIRVFMIFPKALTVATREFVCRRRGRSSGDASIPNIFRLRYSLHVKLDGLWWDFRNRNQGVDWVGFGVDQIFLDAFWEVCIFDWLLRRSKVFDNHIETISSRSWIWKWFSSWLWFHWHVWNVLDIKNDDFVWKYTMTDYVGKIMPDVVSCSMLKELALEFKVTSACVRGSGLWMDPQCVMLLMQKSANEDLANVVAQHRESDDAAVIILCLTQQTKV